MKQAPTRTTPSDPTRPPVRGFLLDIPLNAGIPVLLYRLAERVDRLGRETGQTIPRPVAMGMRYRSPGRVAEARRHRRYFCPCPSYTSCVKIQPATR